MHDAEFVAFAKGLAELAACYGVAKVTQATAPCYWKHLKGRCNLPTEAIMKALGRAVSVYTDFFPSAGQLEALARPIAKTLENRRHFRALPVAAYMLQPASRERTPVHEAADAFEAREIGLEELLSRVSRALGCSIQTAGGCPP